MNHAAVYDRLIARARGRVLEGYSERHHVVPKCVGGSNLPANIVRLTPEEHFVAHQLLVHMYPEAPKLIFALRALCMNTGRRHPGNKVIGWMRRRMAEVVGDMKSGVPRPRYVIEAMRQANLGRVPTEQAVAKMTAALTGKPKAPEHNAKVGRKGRRSPMKGRKHSEETKARMRDAATGRKMSAEAVHKMKHSLTHEQRSAFAHKAWATRRAKSAQTSLF